MRLNNANKVTLRSDFCFQCLHIAEICIRFRIPLKFSIRVSFDIPFAPNIANWTFPLIYGFDLISVEVEMLS